VGDKAAAIQRITNALTSSMLVVLHQVNVHSPLTSSCSRIFPAPTLDRSCLWPTHNSIQIHFGVIVTMSVSFVPLQRLLVPLLISTSNPPPFQHGDDGAGAFTYSSIQEDSVGVLSKWHSDTARRPKSEMDTPRFHSLTARPQGYESGLR